jgi:hypothetical protein
VGIIQGSKVEAGILNVVPLLTLITGDGTHDFCAMDVLGTDIRTHDGNILVVLGTVDSCRHCYHERFWHN